MSIVKRTPLKKISGKQRAREAGLRERKEARVQKQLDEDGGAACQKCGRTFLTLSEAMWGLQGHHKKQRSLAAGEPGTDDDTNIELLCADCHDDSVHSSSNPNKVTPHRRF